MNPPRPARRQSPSEPGQRCRIAALGALILLGASRLAAAPPPSAFDARANAFHYAGEYRDPAWNGAYLRARWYHPQLPAFTSRDPALELVNHYGYGGGNPAMNIDPSGLSYRAFGHGVGAVLHALNGGIGGHFARFFLAPFMGPMQILADPGAFWHALRHNSADMDYFLAAGAAVEAAAPFAVPFSSRAVRFGLRLAFEAGLGVGQTVTNAAQHGFRHLDRGTLVDGLEYTFGPLVTARLAAGLGYQPFNLSSKGIDELWSKTLQNRVEDDQTLFFRARSVGRFNRLNGWTTPWQEYFSVGAYHERLVAVARDQVFICDMASDGTGWTAARWSLDEFMDRRPLEKDFRFEYVGKGGKVGSELEWAGGVFELLRKKQGMIPSAMRRIVSGGESACHQHVDTILKTYGVKR